MGLTLVVLSKVLAVRNGAAVHEQPTDDGGRGRKGKDFVGPVRKHPGDQTESNDSEYGD